MQHRHQALQGAVFAPLLVVPVNRRIRRQIFRQVGPITTILEAVKDAVDNLSIAPFERSSLLFGG